MEWLINLFELAILVAWIYFLFYIGSKKEELATPVFYLLLYAPLILLFAFVTIVYSLFGFIHLFQALSVWLVILVIVFIVERIAWGVTLKEVAGKNKLVWFYVIYLIPFFGWFLYHITNLK